MDAEGLRIVCGSLEVRSSLNLKCSRRILLSFGQGCCGRVYDIEVAIIVSGVGVAAGDGSSRKAVGAGGETAKKRRTAGVGDVDNIQVAVIVGSIHIATGGGDTREIATGRLDNACYFGISRVGNVDDVDVSAVDIGGIGVVAGDDDALECLGNGADAAASVGFAGLVTLMT